jgi:hypothetical protein
MTQYKPTEKPTQYYLPNKWAKYLSYEPETGMGYQVADIYLKGKTLKKVIILGCSTFNHKNKKLNLDTIEKIVVKQREGWKEIKKFQTVSVKKTPTKEEKNEKYYLIEEYKEYSDRPDAAGTSYTSYHVTAYKTQQQLLEAILSGPKHGGKLVPAKGLELKLTEKQDNTNLREDLAEDMKRREQAYRETGDIIDEEKIEKHRADHGVIS